MNLYFPFQWAPTLGGECYSGALQSSQRTHWLSFNGHPPLGVNATSPIPLALAGGVTGFNGHPPLGVNATKAITERGAVGFCYIVSMGTHPWG